jgi:hypothetical protein
MIHGYHAVVSFMDDILSRDEFIHMGTSPKP